MHKALTDHVTDSWSLTDWLSKTMYYQAHPENRFLGE
jgi:hypothetical protein